jgi:succinate dehydrogenase/fumarate reductase flavoprotein subunit
MGGVRVNDQAQTDLPGLFACGEMVWGLHGANRRGGNALTECAVMGLLAGKQAALIARKHHSNGATQTQKSTEPGAGKDQTMAQLRALRLKLRETTWQCAGISRTALGIGQGLKEIENLQAQLEGLVPFSVEEKRQREDLIAGSLVTRAILTASQARQESRGSFMRREFPGEDDAHWLKNSCLTLEPDGIEFSLSHKGV